MMKDYFKIFVRSRLLIKSITYFIVAAGFPILVFGGVALYLINFSHANDVSALELQLISQKSEEVKKFFADTLGILELNVSTDASYIGAADQTFLLQGILKSNPAFEELSFINLDGRETEKVSRSQSDEELDFFDLSRLPYLNKVKKGQNVISDVYYTLDGPMISMIAPVRNRSGKIIDIISAEVSLKSILASVRQGKLGLSGYVYMLDGNGRYISSDKKGGVSPGSDLSGFGRVNKVMNGQVVSGFNAEDRYYNFFNGEAVIGAGKKIPNINWSVFVEWPIEDADAVVAGIRDKAIQFTLLSLFIVLLMAPLFSYQLIGPIHLLEAGAANIEKGNLDTSVTIKTKDELEELGAAFNKMTAGLRRLKELQDEFVFVASHELRAPVTIIKNALEMFVNQAGNSLTSASRDLIDLIKQANDNLGQLVNELLDIARSEAGRLEIEVSACDLASDIKAVLALESSLAAKKQVALEYKPKADLPQVLADAGRIREVVTNLVTNAIKYNKDSGKVTIYHEVSGDMVITHVEDTGLGIPEAEQLRVFHKFFRSDELRIKGITGTGLGLFIVRQLVEKMSGKIWFKSEAGKGSTFSFSLRSVK